MDIEFIICFETHVELGTRTKLFCDCPVVYDAEPNTAVCPVCTGQPGALPVLNRRAVEYAVKAGLALNCRINENARFARKNYFYPDLPKGYQISQFELPFCTDGTLEIVGDDGKPYPVGIKRIHLEEDAGKLVHSGEDFESSDFSLVDYNRSGVPLLEIVGDHERNPIRSLSEAKTYLEKMRQILRYIGISDCAMEKGQLRCDVNISIRPRGASDFGKRSEIKNMSSFKSILDALSHEIARQKEALETGQTLVQETRLFDEERRVTLPMRSKEDAPDYRYFPDPDLVEVVIDEAFVRQVEKEMPELPDRRLERVTKQYGLSRDQALLLTRDRAVSDFFESCAALCRDPRKLAGWITRDLFEHLGNAHLSIEENPISPEHFASLVDIVSAGKITERMGKEVLIEMFKTGRAPEAIIEKRGLKPLDDPALLKKMVALVLEEHPAAAAELAEGALKPIDFFIGQVMKKTRGQADPKAVRKLLEERRNPAGRKE